MSDGYPAEVDTPGARAARQHGTSDRDERQAVAKARMRGERTADTRSRFAPGGTTREDVDRESLKSEAIDRLLAAQVEALDVPEELREPDEPQEPQESDENHADWWNYGLSEGWIDEQGNVAEDAPEDWIAYGHQADYFE